MNVSELIHKLNCGNFPEKGISFNDALALAKTKNEDIYFLFALANKVRLRYRGKTVNLCALTNAKSGNCPEDCAFCAQSSRHHSNIPEYPLVSADEILKQARKTIKETKTNRFCVVISGRGIDEIKDLPVVCDALRRIKKEFPRIKLDASLGFISEDGMKKLKKAGLSRYNHNLETAESHFGRVCTTHKYSDRVKTIKNLKKAGLEVCAGGIIGLGETPKQRIVLAFALKELDVDSIPMNFLNPVPGTQFAKNPAIPPLELLKYIAIFRLIMPDKEIRVCGGRQTNLGNLQPLIFPAGADAIIIGNYLTTPGSSPDNDINMVKSMGLEVSKN